MITLSRQIIEDLKSIGIDTFFGVQGGAVARIIEEIEKAGATYIPVLNEQSAGYSAHGYYLASGKPAGIVATTGPGVTNAISGVASCFYDNIPVVFLIGQVNSSLNTADHFKTKMVGFQELPHLRLIEPLADLAINIKNEDDYRAKRNVLATSLVCDKHVVAIELNDDTQRSFVSNEFKEIELGSSPELKSSGSDIEADLIILGKGAANDFDQTLVEKINGTNLPCVVTWGAQHVAFKLKNVVGIFGTHSPGLANDFVQKSKSPLVIGASLLQHQVGKDPSKFLKNAGKIHLVNRSQNELSRTTAQFGTRLHPINLRTKDFFNRYNIISLQNKEFSKCEAHKGSTTVPNIIEIILRAYSEIGELVFVDAGATLSWTFQALNKINKLKLLGFSSFNLHPMGWANCAQIGADAFSSDKPSLCIIGDGSIPMNIQELLNAGPRNKILVLDNQGYGIIRQTQDQFFNANFLGSSFNGKFPLPKLNLEEILTAFVGEVMVCEENSDIVNVSSKFMNSKAKVLKVNIGPHHKVDTHQF